MLIDDNMVRMNPTLNHVSNKIIDTIDYPNNYLINYYYQKLVIKPTFM